MTFASLFSCGGGADLGAMALGFKPVFGVEINPKIAESYRRNIGEHVIVSCVQAVDYSQWRNKITALWLSPPCTNASIANANAGETEGDIALGTTSARAIEQIMPRYVFLENVANYRNFKAFKIICATLERLGYAYDVQIVDAADFGVPQRRRRLILRAEKDRFWSLPPLPAPVPHVGWFAAVSDIIETFPRSQLAPWQIDRLKDTKWAHLLTSGERTNCLISGVSVHGSCPQPQPEEHPAPPVVAGHATMKAVLFGSGGFAGSIVQSEEDEPAPTITANQNQSLLRCLLMNPNAQNPNSLVQEEQENSHTITAQGGGKLRLVLVDGQSKGPRPPTVTEHHQPSPTLAGTAGGALGRIVDLADGIRVLGVPIAGIARFQTFPDSYQWPALKSLASSVCGNAVPPLMAREIIKSVLIGGNPMHPQIPPDKESIQTDTQNEFQCS